MSSPCSVFGRFINHHQFFFPLLFLPHIIYLLDFIPLIFTFINLICLLILSQCFTLHPYPFTYLATCYTFCITSLSLALPLNVLVPMAHETSYACGISHTRARLIIGYLSLVFLHLFYFITLSQHYSPCRKTTLRL